MSPVIRTGIYVGAAALLVLLALFTSPGGGKSDGFGDEGELFFPEFTDPAQAVALEVYEVDQESAAAKIFKVQRKDGVWTIPSHYDYPADAKDRMAEAASALIGLRKGSVRSDSRADHVALGVVDPMDQEAGLEGRGVLVSFRGEGENDLGKLIIGKTVEGRTGQRFVRVPGKRRTYTATLSSDLSTRFADWVETDLLKLGARDIRKLVFDNYSVDEEAGVIRTGETVVATKDDDAWTVEGQTETEEPNTEKLDDAGRALDDLKIVGVRPKPDGLTQRLETARGFNRDVLLDSLAGKGYFLVRDKLYSNEGDLLVSTADGVRYTLKFGEILYGGADEVSSETGDDGEKAEPKDARPNRYLMVTADLDESVLVRPEGVAIPAAEVTSCRSAIREIEDIVRKVDARKEAAGTPPENLADAIGDTERLAKDPWDRPYDYEVTEDGYRVISRGRDGETGGEGADADIVSDDLETARERLDAAEDIRSHEEKVEASRKRVADLAARFAPWYYVIDAALYDRLKLARTDVVKPIEEPGDDSGDEPGETPGTPPDDGD